MNKLIILLVAILATLASVNAQSAPVTVSLSLSQTASQSLSVSNSLSLSNSVSNSLSSSLSSSFSSSISASVSMTMTPSSSETATETMTGTGTPSVSTSLSNSVTGTISVTQTGSVSMSWSPSVTGVPSMTATISAAPAPTALTQVTAGCGSGRKMICVSWSRPAGVPAQSYLVTLTGTVSGAKQEMNFTNGETFAMFSGLMPSTAYVVAVQTWFLGTLSAPATLSITTAAPSPKQVPSLGITGFSCRAMPQPNMKKKRSVMCSWTNGVTPYTMINLRIKCAAKPGSAFDGKNRNVRRMLKAGLTSWTENGFFMNARCKVIMNPAYSVGPGRRVVQVLEVV